MQNYESIFVVRPTVPEEVIQQLTEKLTKQIEKSGGVLVKTEQWGKRKLGYEVKKERKGFYTLFYLKGNGTVVSDLERQYKLDDSIIKYLTVRTDRPYVEPQEETVEPQASAKEEKV